MTSEHRYSLRSCLAFLLVLAVSFAPLRAADVDATRTRFRDLHGADSLITVKLASGERVSGKILRVEADGATLREERSGKERTLSYSDVAEVKKKRLSRRAKSILIPAAIGGGVLLVMCAGPYPIGFLCRKDPS